MPEPHDCPPEDFAAYDKCAKHGYQIITEEQAFRGFAGGTSYVWTLACGCTLADESGDEAAAR